ncbi:MAG: hypothetical protein QOJ34_1279 [Pseudonocardiales bacterium]|jgi:hypothetical protein|nr:hypothetical protein [Pseudonocardiales bacterium]
MPSPSEEHPADAPRASPEDDRAAVGVLDRFWDEYGRSVGADASGAELLPTRLARACAYALGVDGAGLSVLESDFRVPLGASSDMASHAERLQFTQGEGPCLDAVSEGHDVAAGAADLRRRWPQFADALFSETSYRAVITMPLSVTNSTRGALDLFFVDEARLGTLRLADTAHVSAAIVRALRDADALDRPVAQSEWTDEFIPGWLTGAAANHRRVVWFAVGMTMARFDVSGPDALALLRAYAYGHGDVLDEVAAALVEGRLHLKEIQN